MRFLYYWRRNLDDFLQRHSGPVLLLAVLFVIGVIFGALAVRSISVRDKLELVAYLSEPLGVMRNPGAVPSDLLLKQQLMGKLKVLALLWVLGISLVGAFGVMVIAFVRGVISGFLVGFLASELGGAGVLLAMAGHLPASLVEVPALILAGTASVAFSLQVVRSWRERRRVPQFYRALASYTGTLLAMGVLLVIACLLESYLSPVLIRFVLSLVDSV